MSFASTIRFIEGLPKVDLHCHLLGAVDASLFAYLVGTAGIELPDTPENIYKNLATANARPDAYLDSEMNPDTLTHLAYDDLSSSYSLASVFGWIYEALDSVEDFELMAYDCARRAAATNTLHIEYDLTLGERTRREVTDAETIAAVVRGLDRAEREFGITAGLTIGIDRAGTSEEALAVVEQLIAMNEPRIFGISLSASEFGGAPVKFTEAYARAREAGLRGTAHASEHVPSAVNALEAITVVGMDRIDHGYFLLDDPTAVVRAIMRSVPFTCIMSTSRLTWRPWRRAAIRSMQRAGLKLVISSDDPGMFPTNLNQEYRIAALELGFTPAELIGIVRNGIDACWLPEDAKQRLRLRAEEQICTLVSEMGIEFV
jgi:adenosine deaminase